MKTHTITVTHQEYSIILDALWSHATTMLRGQPFERDVAKHYDALACKLSKNDEKTPESPVRPIAVFNNEKSWTVENVIASLRSEEIEHICVVRKMKDGILDSVCSTVDQGTLALLMMTLQRRAFRAMEDNLDDDEG